MLARQAQEGFDIYIIEIEFVDFLFRIGDASTAPSQ